MSLELNLQKTRSYRRFVQAHHVPEQLLKDLVNLTRFCASARNAQPLKYLIANTLELCQRIFPLTAWAGYLKDWDGPEEGERPAAYILVVKDTSIATNIHCDDGIAIQTIMLGATEKGLGGCILGAFNKEMVSDIFNLSLRYEPLYLLALGKPNETVIVEDIDEGDFKYWRDESGIHHVPKRRLDELILTVNEPFPA